MWFVCVFFHPVGCLCTLLRVSFPCVTSAVDLFFFSGCSCFWCQVCCPTGHLPGHGPTAALTSGIDARSQDQHRPQTGSKLWGCMALPRWPEVKRQCREPPWPAAHSHVQHVRAAPRGQWKGHTLPPGWTPESPLPTRCWVPCVQNGHLAPVGSFLPSYFLHFTN